MGDLIQGVFNFSFYYPLFMAYLWMIGGVYYYFHWEAKERRSYDHPPKLSASPPVSIVIPCFNEEQNIEETIGALTEIDYPDYEIIAINDGSDDQTGSMLEKLAKRIKPLRVVHLASNQGKATALRVGTLVARNEYLVCIDGDAMLDRHAVTWIVQHFLNGPRVGAVTGNPRIRNRSTLLGKIQVGEFSSIIGLIKRAQRIYGRVFTISGVVKGMRKSALHRIGYWSTDMVTEDIDVSWKLQLDHWDIRYEPRALCWILMPETLNGLWRQRVRWAQGGAEVLLKYLPYLFSWRKRRMWPVYTELLVSVCWAYLMALTCVIWLIGLVVPVPETIKVRSLLPPDWTGVMLGLTCLLQFAVSMLIDSRYEKGSGKMYYWMIWYPMAYWFINVITTLAAVPRAVLARRRRTSARWISPDRGLHAGAR
jgi:biofilm PGA synthesis N-glycosyltransferase PgaC